MNEFSRQLHPYLPHPPLQGLAHILLLLPRLLSMLSAHPRCYHFFEASGSVSSYIQICSITDLTPSEEIFPYSTHSIALRRHSREGELDTYIQHSECRAEVILILFWFLRIPSMKRHRLLSSNHVSHTLLNI